MGQIYKFITKEVFEEVKASHKKAQDHTSI